MTWWILLGVATLILLLHWSSKNAVWGTATLGVIVGISIALFNEGFDWWIVGKSLIIATFIGAAIEWLPRILEKRSSSRS